MTYVPKAWDAGATTTGAAARRRIDLTAAARAESRPDPAVGSCGSSATPWSWPAARSTRRCSCAATGWARSGQLGRNLSIHPATAVRALFDEQIDMARGVPQSYYIDEFADEGIMFEGAAGPPDYLAMALPLLGGASPRADAAATATCRSSA